MNSEDSKKVKWFKKEFESYLSQSPIRKQIETKIELLKSKFDLHSSQWGSVHYSGIDNDCKLAEYVAKEEEVEKKKRKSKALLYMEWIYDLEGTEEGG